MSTTLILLIHGHGKLDIDWTLHCKSCSKQCFWMCRTQRQAMILEKPPSLFGPWFSECQMSRWANALSLFQREEPIFVKSHVTLKLPLAFFRQRRTWPSRSPMTVAFHSPEGTAIFRNQHCLVAITVLMTIVVKEAFALWLHIPFTWTADSRVHFAPEETLQPLFQEVEGQQNVTRDEWGQGLTLERDMPWGVSQERPRGLHLWLNHSPDKAHTKLSSLLFLSTVLTQLLSSLSISEKSLIPHTPAN